MMIHEKMHASERGQVVPKPAEQYWQYWKPRCCYLPFPSTEEIKLSTSKHSIGIVSGIVPTPMLTLRQYIVPTLRIAFAARAKQHPRYSQKNLRVMSVAANDSKRKMKSIGTHSGTFHCDEALGCFLLHQVSTHASISIR